MIKNDFKQKIAGRKTLITMAIIVFILSSCIFYIFLLPQRDLISQLKNKCETGRIQIRKVSSFVREYPDYDSHLNELNRKLNRLENMLPDKFFLSGFLQEAEKISKETGVAIIDIRPLNEMQQGDYSELPIEMIIRGSFEEVLDFTKKVENFQRFISISAANISPSSPGQAEKLIPELEGRLLLVIYSSN